MKGQVGGCGIWCGSCAVGNGAIRDTLEEAIDLGGRDTEHTLFGEPGGYVPILDKRSRGTPCTNCSTPIEKIQYLGGSCYICPNCQP